MLLTLIKQIRARRGQRYLVKCYNREICISKRPIYAAASILSKEGFPDATELLIKLEDEIVVRIFTTIGEALARMKYDLFSSTTSAHKPILVKKDPVLTGCTAMPKSTTQRKPVGDATCFSS